ncbi:MAG: hypothetical protein ABMA64_37745 [Myxococcota bacterium]
MSSLTVPGLIARWPELTRLARAAERHPDGAAAEYFRDLSAAVDSGDGRLIEHVLRSGGVR